MSKSSSEFKIDDFLFQISSEDIELIQNSVIDKIVFQYFSSDSTDIQTESTQISEMRYDKIKNFAFCILNLILTVILRDKTMNNLAVKFGHSWIVPTNPD